jgi:hypothetical protein
MKLQFAFIFLIFLSCKENKNPIIAANEKFIDSLHRADMVDSMLKSTIKATLLDTTGVHLSPIKVLSAKFVSKEYSNYKDIRLTFKNTSNKRIEAIRFAWYGTTAFGDPADMGVSVMEGFGGGFTDRPINPGKIDGATWDILSRNGKTVVLAWPNEIMFSDGTKWELKH